MTQRFNLNIDKPCSKNFNQFQPTDIGGFCGSCQKEVIDFSTMSDSEIISYFKKSKSNVCGQFKKSQLKTYSDSIYSKEKSRFNWISAGILSFSLLTILPINKSFSQQNAEIKASAITASVSDKTNVEVTKIEKESHNITGIVMDETDPLIGVNIILKGTTTGTVTDIDGKFEFPKPLETGDVLIFSYVGYDSKEFVVTNNAPISINIKMAMCTAMMMGEVAVHKLYSSKRSFKQKVKGLFK